MLSYSCSSVCNAKYLANYIIFFQINKEALYNFEQICNFRANPAECRAGKKMRAYKRKLVLNLRLQHQLCLQSVKSIKNRMREIMKLLFQTKRISAAAAEELGVIDALLAF